MSKRYFRIDSVSGVMLEQGDSIDFGEGGWIVLKNDDKITLLGQYPIIRVKELTKDEYDKLAEEAESLDNDSDEAYADPESYHQHIMGSLNKNNGGGLF